MISGILMNKLRIGLAQCNFSVGDLDGNVSIIQDVIGKAQRMGVQLLAFPELALTGYPPEDLLLKSSFIHAAEEALKQVAKSVQTLVCVLGTVHVDSENFNAAAIINQGQVVNFYHKQILPNYGVFDEKRYFKEGVENQVLVLNGIPIGISICEDIWYSGGPAACQAELGKAKLLLNISSSPYHVEKWKVREDVLVSRARENGTYVAYVNLVGGQDELVFDGGSMIYDPDGNLVARGKFFEEDLVVVDLELGNDGGYQDVGDDIKQVVLETPDTKMVLGYDPVMEEVLEPVEEVRRALVLGTGDYMRKTGFTKAVIGLSGGIDSALVAAIAAEAVGADNVLCVTMPSEYSSLEGLEDTRMTAENLGIELIEIPISAPFQVYKDLLAPHFGDLPEDITEENLQARIRGNLLMAISNKMGYLVLTTGNKSEMAVGYATLYGDMAGGFAVIKDVPKLLVFDLCRHINQQAGSEIIPQRVIDKPPSAELRPDQKDTDSLPPYEVLDPILQAYVEDIKGVDEIVAMGFERDTVKRVVRLVDRSEYKRRQAPPGVKITPLAFGRDRRLPISNRFVSKMDKNK